MRPIIHPVCTQADERFSLPARLRCLAIRATVVLLSALLFSGWQARADTVSTVGSMQVDADSAVDGTFDGLLTDPQITEDSIGELAAGSQITISRPDAHFEFNTAAIVTAVGTNGMTLALDTLAADQIVFQVTAASAGAPATITFSGIEMRAIDANGAVAGPRTITVTTAGTLNNALLVDVEVVPGAASALQSTVAFAAGSDGSARANNVDTIVIEVLLRDQFNNAIAGEDVLLRQENDNPLPGDISVSPANPGQTDAAGAVSFTLTSATVQALSVEGFVAADGVELDPLAIEFITPTTDPVASTVVATDNTAIADGIDAGQITVTLLDADGVPLVGHALLLRVVSASVDPDVVTFSPPAATSNGSGAAVFDVRSTIPQNVTFSAVDITDLVTLNGSDVVTFTDNVAEPAQCTVVAADGQAIADGVDTELITVTVRNGFGTPLAAHQIALTPDNPLGVTVDPPTADTNGDGVALFAVSSTEANVVTFEATDVEDPGNPVSVGSVPVTFLANQFDDGRSWVMPEDGTAEVGTPEVVTVTLRNSLGNPVPNTNVVLAVASASVDAGAVSIVPPPPGGTSTNAQGQALFTATSTVAQSVVFAAAAAGTPLTDTATVDFALATNLVAEAIGVAFQAGTTSVTITYAIEGVAAVNPFIIRLRVDPDGAGPTAESAIDLGAGDGVVFTPGTHTITRDITAELSGLIEHGATVAADVDANDDVPGEPAADNQVSTALEVNLQAGSVGVTRVGADAVATVTYSVSSPAAVPNFTIQLQIDADNDAVFESLVNLAGDPTPGIHTAATSVLVNLAGVLQNGGQVVAVVDALAEVTEREEIADNQVSTALQVDLTASAIVLDPALNATLTYVVDSPAEVRPFEIEFYLDTNLNNVLDAGDAQVGPTQPGDAGPGSHTIAQSFAVTPPATGQFIFAQVDTGGAVAELVELNNVAGSQNAAITDLVANATGLSPAGVATVSYTVQSPANVDAYRIRLRLEDDLGVVVVPDLATFDGDVTPGAHEHTVDIRAALNAAGVEQNYSVVAELDIDGTVAEGDEGNNTAATAPIAVDLQVAELVLFEEGFQAVFTYTVTGPAAVPAYDIVFALDANGNNALDAGEALVTVAGNRNPGTHTAPAGGTLDLAAPLRARGITADASARILAVLDPGNAAVGEGDEANNQTAKTGTYEVDLQMVFLDFPGVDLDTRFEISIQYRVAFNRPVEDFAVGVYASRDDNLSIGADDVLLRRVNVTAASAKTVGIHGLDITNLEVRASDFPDGRFFLKVRIDDQLALAEVDEGNNVLTQTNAGQNLLNADLDGDGLTLGQELDGFELLIFRADEQEPRLVAAGETSTDDNKVDTDGDGLSDRLERELGTDPTERDTDADGLSDTDEHAGVTDPADWDTDGDGLSDGEELAGFALTRYAPGSNTGRFSEATVSVVHTDPLNPDTDGDGIADWDEVNTFALLVALDGLTVRVASAESLASIGLEDLAARADREVRKPVFGIRTDPTGADTDEDGLPDGDDPAPQINPARWGYDTNDDDVFDLTDLAEIRRAAEAAGQDTTRFPTDVRGFQRRLLDFDQDADGFLEAPDANGDGFPDFTRYNEATLEQAFGIDFSNDGSLDDGFDVGGLGQGPEDSSPEDRPGAVGRGVRKFGTFRVMRAADGSIAGDGTIDLIDSLGQLIPTDNCPNQSNPQQLDFDGDGLGDDCDADLDNDGVPEPLDPFPQDPTQRSVLPPLCGLGATQTLLFGLVGLAGVRCLGSSRRGRRPRR